VYIADIADIAYIAYIADIAYIAEIAYIAYIADIADIAYIADIAEIQNSGHQSAADRQRKNHIDLFFTFPKTRGAFIINFFLMKTIQTTKLWGKDIWQ